MKRPRRATVRGLFRKTEPQDTKPHQHPGEVSAALYGPPDIPLSVRKRADEYFAARRLEDAVDAELERRRADT